MFRPNIARTAFMSNHVITAIWAFRSSPSMSVPTGIAIIATVIFIVIAIVGAVRAHLVMIGVDHLPAGTDLRHHALAIGTAPHHVRVTVTGIVHRHVPVIATGTARRRHVVPMMAVGNSVTVRSGIVVSVRRAVMTGATMTNAATTAETITGETIIAGILRAGARTAGPVATMAINHAANMIRTANVAAPMIGANHACPACQVAARAFNV